MSRVVLFFVERCSGSCNPKIVMSAADPETTIKQQLGRPLSDSESHVLNGFVTHGNLFPGTLRRPTISGKFVAALFRMFCSDGQLITLLPPHVTQFSIQNLFIEGDIDLFDLVPTISMDLCSLNIRSCKINGGINLSRARLSDIQLDHCMLSHLIADDSNIAVGVSISSCTPHQGGSFSVDLSRARLGTGIRIHRSSLSSATIEDSALRLTDADIGASVIIGGDTKNPVTFLGAVELIRTRIGRDLSLRGTVVDAGGRISVNAIEAVVGGGIDFSSGQFLGRVLLDSARVDGGLSLFRAKIAALSGPSLSMMQSTIGLSLDLDEIEVTNGVKLNNLVVSVDIKANQAKITAARDHEAVEARQVSAKRFVMRKTTLGGGGLALQGARVGSTLSLDGSIIGSTQGRCVSMGGAFIEGQLSIESAQLAGTCEFRNTSVRSGVSLSKTEIRSGADPSIVMLGCSIAGTLELRNGFRASGQVDLAYIKVGQNIAAEGASFTREDGPSLRLSFANISGSVWIRRSGSNVGGADSLCAGGLVASSARIDGDFFVEQATLGAPGRAESDKRNFSSYALDVVGARIGGTLTIKRCVITGPLRLTQARVGADVTLADSVVSSNMEKVIEGYAMRVEGGINLFNLDARGHIHLDRTRAGEVRWEKLKLGRPSADICTGTTIEPMPDGRSTALGEAANRALLSIKGADIGRRLRAISLIVPGNAQAVIDLTGSNADVLSDERDGWGGASQVQLILEGFRFHRLLDRRGLSGQKGPDTSRIRWLHRQYPGGVPQADFYRRQVYQNLARAQFTAGYDEEARLTVATAERHRRQAGLIPLEEAFLSKGFDLAFGLGTSKRRAILTVSIVWLGALLLCAIAADSDRMVRVDGTGASTGARCGRELNVGLYSIDAIVPFSPLGQTRKCGPGIPSAEKTASPPTFKFLTPASDIPEWVWISLFAGIKGLGWLVITLAVFTYTGVISRLRNMIE
jgi:uncharacterized protein YjbI with pentapeptide repeats